MSPQPYDAIYLSPHLDDVVLSCGGSIHCAAREGQRALVVTLFAGSPPDHGGTAFARELRERWGGAADPVAERQREDLAAMAAIGAEALHLPLYDCVYRQGPAGEALYPTVESIFGDVHPQECCYHEVLLEALRPALEGSPRAVIVSPLTIGHHVDHIVAWRAALTLREAGRRVAFYEDYPYAAEPAVVEAGRPHVPGARWVGECRHFLEEDLCAKGAGVAAYASQISTFWPDLDAMRADLRRVAILVGSGRYAERLWRLVDGLGRDNMGRGPGAGTEVP